MQLLAWLKSKSKAESMIGEALIALEMGDSKKAGGDLVQGLIDLAPAGGKAAAYLGTIQAKLVAEGLITADVPPSPAVPVAETPPPASPTPPAAPA